MHRLLPLALLALAACGKNIQTTSGTDYLSRYETPVAAPASPAPEAGPAARRNRTPAKADQPVASGPPRSLDEAVIRAASVEPTLRLPARFGLARIVNGLLTLPSEAETALLRGLAERHASLGSFVPVSPVVAGAATEAVYGPHAMTPYDSRFDPVSVIRIGAARQHLDAVLIYEVDANASKENTFLALADLTLIGGAILPTRSLKAEGVAQALLLDVRNGYPYGTASARADLSALSVSFGSDAAQAALRDRAVAEVVENLVPEVETMLRTLAHALPPRG